MSELKWKMVNEIVERVKVKFGDEYVMPFSLTEFADLLVDQSIAKGLSDTPTHIRDEIHRITETAVEKLRGMELKKRKVAAEQALAK